MSAHTTWASVSMELEHPKAPSLSAAELMPYINSVTYHESLDALDFATVSIQLPQTGHPAQTHLAAMVPGGTVCLRFLKEGAEKHTAYLDVTRVSHSTSATGLWTVTLTCLEVLARLQNVRVNEVATEQTDLLELLVDEARKVMGGTAQAPRKADASEEGLAIFGDRLLGRLKELSNQRNLLVRAELSSALGRPKIVFEELASSASGFGDVALHYAVDVLSLQAELDLSEQVTGVVVRGLADPLSDSGADADPTPGEAPRRKPGSGVFSGLGLLSAKGIQKVVEYEAWTEPPETGHAAPGLRSRSHALSNASKPSALSAQAQLKYEDHAEKFLRGTVVCRGQPEARKNGVLSFADAPWPWRGAFVITDVQHTYNDTQGLTSAITFRATELTRP